MTRCPPVRSLVAIALLSVLPSALAAQEEGSTDSAEVHAAVDGYDAALRRGDAEAAAAYWAPEFVFINPLGERLTRADRIANFQHRRTAFDSLAHVEGQEQIRVYGDVAVYTTLLAIGGRYSGHPEHGQFRALVVWVRRDGRWQQVANQLTPVLPPRGGE